MISSVYRVVPPGRVRRNTITPDSRKNWIVPAALTIAVVVSLAVGAYLSAPYLVSRKETVAVQSKYLRGVNDVGAIRSFVVPAKWNLATFNQDDGGYEYSWRPQYQSDVSLSVAHRGPRLTPFDAEPLNLLLDQPAHDITGEELECIKRVLDHTPEAEAEACEIASAKTKDVGGTRVLVLVRHYTLKGMTRETIYIDVEGDGSVLQLVSFIAPKEKYAAYSQDAQQAFASLKIKPASR